VADVFAIFVFLEVRRFKSEFIGARAEALAMFDTVAADLFFNCWDLEVLLDYLVRYTPRCVCYYSQSLTGSVLDFLLGMDVVPQRCML
jgi:hypothetical protein